MRPWDLEFEYRRIDVMWAFAYLLGSVTSDTKTWNMASGITTARWTTCWCSPLLWALKMRMGLRRAWNPGAFHVPKAVGDDLTGFVISALDAEIRILHRSLHPMELQRNGAIGRCLVPNSSLKLGSPGGRLRLLSLGAWGIYETCTGGRGIGIRLVIWYDLGL